MSAAEFFVRALLGGGALCDAAVARAKEQFSTSSNPVRRFNDDGTTSPAVPQDLLDPAIILVVNTTAGTFETRANRDHPTANMTQAQMQLGFKKIGLHKMLAYYALYLQGNSARLRQLLDSPEDCSHIIQPAHTRIAIL